MAHCWPKNDQQSGSSFLNLNQLIVLANTRLTVSHLSVICWQFVDDYQHFFWKTELLLQVAAAYRTVVCLSVNCQSQSTDRWLTDFWVNFTTQNEPAAGNFTASNGTFDTF